MLLCACIYRGRLRACSIVRVSMIHIGSKPPASASAVEMLKRFYFFFQYLKEKL